MTASEALCAVRMAMDMAVLLFGLRMPPKHELFDHEEEPETCHKGDAQAVGVGGPGPGDGLGQQCKEGRAEKRAGSEAEKVRQ